MVLSFLTGSFREPAECVIEVGGTEVTDLYPFLSEVRVEASRAEAAQATMTFESRRDERGEWSVQDAGILRTWETIEIEAAFGTRTETVLRGRIREINASYPSDPASSRVTVTCQDQSYALDREHRRRSWGEPEVPTTDVAIVTTILGDHGLVRDPASGSGGSELVLTQDSTDIRFLRSRAEANGYELIFGTDTVYFGPLRVAATAQPAIMVYAGPDTNCYRFDVRDDGHRPDRVAYNRAANSGAESEEEVVEPDLEPMGTEAADSSGSGLDPFVWRMARHGSSTATDLRAMAQRRANEHSLRIRAQGELDGSRYGHVLRVGEPVGVDGVGPRYAGTYYVDTVTHRFTEEGYRQEFTLLRNAYGDNLAAGGSLPGALR